MTSKEALCELFTEATRLSSENLKFRTDELLERFITVSKDLEVLEQVKVKIDEEIKKQEKVIIEYDNYAWKTQQLNTNFLIAVNVKNTLEKLKEWLENL